MEVVDKKIDSLVGDVRKDVSRKIEDKSVEIDIRLRELDERSVVLEMGLGELKLKDLLRKDDLMRLYDEMKKGKGFGVGEGEMGLDEIRTLAREIVENEIEKYVFDGFGMVDYALVSGGAMVVKYFELLVVGKVGNWFFTINRSGVYSDVDKMLKLSFGEFG